MKYIKSSVITKQDVRQAERYMLMVTFHMGWSNSKIYGQRLYSRHRVVSAKDQPLHEWVQEPMFNSGSIL